MSNSLYDILGVSKSDSCTSIKKVYFKLARTHHPDKGGDPEKFKEILRASEVLTDEKKRRMYDECGIIDGEMESTNRPFHPFQNGFPFEINMNDLFGNMFQQNMFNQVKKNKKPAPTVQSIHITLEQFYLGHSFDIHINRQNFCKNCDNGAKIKESCKPCNGRGVISKLVHLGPMSMHTSGPCTDCQGKGDIIIEKCEKCTGTGYFQEKRALSVKIAPGTRPQETYIFSEVCSDHPSFERPGDAHIIVTEDPNDVSLKHFKRVGDKLENLETTVSISLSESLIGCIVQMDGHPGYDEGLFINIPAGSFHSDKYCLSGFGMPIPGNIGKYGDLIIIIHTNITPNERSLFTTKGRELLLPHFGDKIRIRECTEDSIQKDLYLLNH